MRYLLLLSVILLRPAPASAQTDLSDVPAVVTDGLAAFVAEGVDAALDVWLQTWPDEDVAVGRPQLRSAFQRLHEQAGSLMGHDFVGSAPWGQRARRVYFVMLYEKQPVYARFDVYRATNEWKVVNLTVNTDPALIFPPDLFVPQ